MPVSSLVISLSCDAALANAALRALEGEPRIEVGEGSEGRIPIVLDTPNREEDKDVWRWLNALPGVEFVDVVFVHFGDDDHVLRPDALSPEAASPVGARKESP